MTALLKKLARKMFTRPVSARVAAPIQKALLGCETFEQRVVPALVAPVGGDPVQITSIGLTSGVDKDQNQALHVSVEQGQSAMLAVGFNYNVDSTAAVTGKLNVIGATTISTGPFANLPTLPAIGMNNGSLSIAIPNTLAVGSYTVQVQLKQGGGAINDSEADAVAVVAFDVTPPVISKVVTGTLGTNGWYTSDVTVDWTATDAQSTITSTSGADPAYVTTDTTGTTLSFSATSAGGTSSDSVTIKRDATPPTITGAATTSPNANGWYNTAVTVHFDASDATSGITSVTADQTLSGEGENQSVTGYATNGAGLTSSTTISGINIDLTGPSISATSDGAAYAAAHGGWNNTDVTVSYTFSDNAGGSGVDAVASSTGNDVLSSSGTASGTVVDLAGNSASDSLAIQIDKSAATTNASFSGTAGLAGWYTSGGTLTLTAADQVGLSGVAATFYSLDGINFTEGTSVALSADGVYTVSFYSVDVAGNIESTKTATIKIDSAGPTLSGLNNITSLLTDMTGASISYTDPSATDAMSGLASLTFNPLSGHHFDAGTTTTVTVTATDEAGNVSTGTFTVSVLNVGVVGGNLVVLGTNVGNDNITVTGSGSSVTVTGTGASTDGTYALGTGGRVIANLGAGDDILNASGLNGIVLEAHGGDGADTITGGSANDVIFGDGGDDTLTGGSGNDVIVGGIGKNRLVGSSGNDILIAGDLLGFDYNALVTLSNNWSGNITSDLAGDNDDDVTTVTNDAADSLTGGAGKDWFIVSLGLDKITDMPKDILKDGDKLSSILDI